jgi:transcriptional regulator with XRE-family HTH domain
MPTSASEAARVKDIRARFGAALRELRVRRELTQEQLAERSGLSYKFVGEIERGLGNPALTSIAGLASGLGIGLPELFATVEQPRPPEPEYRIPQRDLQAVREALASIESAFSNIGSSPCRLKRRRRRRR